MRLGRKEETKDVTVKLAERKRRSRFSGRLERGEFHLDMKCEVPSSVQAPEKPCSQAAHTLTKL